MHALLSFFLLINLHRTFDLVSFEKPMAPGSKARESKQPFLHGPAAVAGKPSPRPELPVSTNRYEPLSTDSSSADEAVSYSFPRAEGRV